MVVSVYRVLVAVGLHDSNVINWLLDGEPGGAAALSICRGGT